MTKQELELLELITIHISEYGWVDDNQFYIWVDYEDVSDITRRLSDIFGNNMFEENCTMAILRDGFLVIDLVEALDWCDEICIEDVFDREKYKY